MLICCENTASIPECLEDVDTSETIKVEPTVKSLVTATKLTDEQVPVLIKKESEMNGRSRPLKKKQPKSKYFPAIALLYRQREFVESYPSI